MVFRDGTQQWDVSMPTGHDATRDVAMNDDATLAEFFQRPIFTRTYDWAPGGATFYQTFDPWGDFFGNKRVVNRIANFNLMSADLCVKFIINGNPFYYGRLMADYAVLPNLDKVTDYATGLQQLIPASQRMHIYLNPTTSEGGTIRCPFIFNKDALSIPASEWTELGRIYIRQLSALKHANASTVGLTIQVAVWAENVKLSVPTTLNPSTIVNQAGDEYGDTKISDIATSMASTMNTIRDVPVIGSYAKSTSTMLSSLGKMAKMFGYARPAIISDAMQMRQMPIGPLANTDRGDSVTKLTYDTKQELSIDPKIMGVDTGDELAISSIVTRESYLTQFVWGTTDANATHIFNIRVNPNACANIAGAYFLPACAFAALPFKYWRGTMKYRFQIVASEYHRGRLQFSYDPNYRSNAEANIQFSRIIDLENERDFTIEVAWAHPRHYLQCNPVASTPNYHSTTAYAATDAFFSNGTLSVNVLNKLTAPSVLINNDISVNVFVSMCDDAEFAVFDTNAMKLTTLAPSATVAVTSSIVNQAGDFVEDNTANAPEMSATDETIQHCLPVDHTNDVYFGERIVSFRSLLKRYMYLTSYKNVSTANGIWTLVQPNFPPYRGQFSSALGLAAGAIKYNFCNVTLMNYLAPAYVGYRGSLRSKYMVFNDQPSIKSYAFISRQNTPSPQTSTAVVINNTSNSSAATDSLSVFADGSSGTLATVTDIMPVLEVEFPYYSDIRFETARNPNLLGTGGGADSHSLVVQSTNTASSISGAHRYVSVGEDFTLMLFQGCPPLYIRSNAVS